MFGIPPERAAGAAFRSSSPMRRNDRAYAHLASGTSRRGWVSTECHRREHTQGEPAPLAAAPLAGSASAAHADHPLGPRSRSGRRAAGVPTPAAGARQLLVAQRLVGLRDHARDSATGDVVRRTHPGAVLTGSVAVAGGQAAPAGRT